MEHHEIANPVLKVASAWALIGVTSWAEAASFFAAMYTLLLICEWSWKKAIRPLLGHFGIIKQKAVEDAAE